MPPEWPLVATRMRSCGATLSASINSRKKPPPLLPPPSLAAPLDASAETRNPVSAPSDADASLGGESCSEMAFELDTVADDWQLALDGAVEAVDAADRAYTAEERARLRRSLAQERAETAVLLERLAHMTGSHNVPWLSPVPLHPSSLGLSNNVRACIFDLEGVLTDSGVVHAAAWAEVFDDLLLRLALETERQFVPFDPDLDYRTYIDGRPRLEGIHLFLRSRGIRLPEGLPEDRADAESAYGLARHKSEALARVMRRRGVSALPGARRFLESAGRAGLGRAVVSGSQTVLPMLELAEISALVDARVDADAIRTEGLRSRPAPDLLLAACRQLGVEPEETVSFVHSPDGVAAGHAAGITVVGVGLDEASRERLEGFGPERVVPSLATLLDRRLLAA
jgi:HAD superfamily hydrolase (TIGR01509 family)